MDRKISETLACGQDGLGRDDRWKLLGLEPEMETNKPSAPF